MCRGRRKGQIWNAHVDVKNATEVGLGWGVTDDVTPGGIKGYDARITLTLPQRAGDATVVKKSKNETVVLDRDASLACGPNNTIEAIVTYRVSPNNSGATGSQVLVKVANNAGQKAPPTGGVLGQATGQVGQDITVKFVIRGTCA